MTTVSAKEEVGERGIRNATALTRYLTWLFSIFITKPFGARTVSRCLSKKEEVLLGSSE